MTGKDKTELIEAVTISAQNLDAVAEVLRKGKALLHAGAVVLAARTLRRCAEIIDSVPTADRAETFLSRVLANGPKPVKEIFADANRYSISEGLIRRAKRALRVKAKNVGGAREKQLWVWDLPRGRKA